MDTKPPDVARIQLKVPERAVWYEALLSHLMRSERTSNALLVLSQFSAPGSRC